MAIYEYRCVGCGREFDRLVLRQHAAAAPACPCCRGLEVIRRFSRFAVHCSEASRLADFDATRARDPDFYRDTRNVGLGAKRRAQQLGVDMGGRLDEIVEKARTGRFLDE